MVEQQVQRMLRDPRSDALVDNFASRWLELGKLAGVVPDTDLYREFDENLRDAMEKETKLFIGNQVRNDRSVVELMTADYTFLNQRLATHYGIPDIYGDHFRKVTFTDGRRGGLLGQGSLLTITSYPNRTSVVDARAVGAGQPAGCAAAAAAARRACAAGRGRRRGAAIAPRADGDAPGESRVRVVPPADGSARVFAGEFRRARKVARPRATARRSMRRRRFPTARRSTVSPGCGRCSRATRKTSCGR